MKRILTILLCISAVMAARAQDFDNTPSINIDNRFEQLKFTVGARFVGDVGYFFSDRTLLKSGATIADARIRTSLTFKEWYFYADFGFGGGRFSQKNIFLQYKRGLDVDRGGFMWVKCGYFCDPGSMALNTSLGSYHFISRPSAAMALGVGRELGLTWKFTNTRFFANQGVYTDHAYNQQEAGFSGISISGRWVYRPVATDTRTLAVGLGARLAHRGGGRDYHGINQKYLNINSSLESYVDGRTDLVEAEIPWVDNTVNVGCEALWRTSRIFVRGEYLFKHLTKHRDDEALMAYDNANGADFGSIDLWRAANPLRDNTFHGGYIEAGVRIFGNPYSYNIVESVLGGLSGKSLEIVARYNYVNLNDVVDGEYYDLEKEKYFPTGADTSVQYNSASVGGGRVNSYTVGVNFSFNKYAQVMLDYTYVRLDRDSRPLDRNFHEIQTRVMFTF